MKKLFAGLCGVAMLLSMTACGGSNKTDDTEDANEKESQEIELSQEDIALDELAIAQGMQYTDAKSILDQKGYQATYIYGGEDWGEVLDAYPVEDLAEYVVKGIQEIDPEAKTITVELDTKTNIAYAEDEQALNEKLNQTSALIAVKEYGQKQYGKDFDLHYMMGLNDASAEDADTWVFKVEAELDGENMTVDAKVTGTTDSPEVISFDMY